MTSPNQPPPEGRLVILTSGSDWTDAGYSHMMIPESVDLEAAEKACRKWYNEVYCAPSNWDDKRRPKIKCIHFPEWLEKYHGATFIEIEEYHE